MLARASSAHSHRSAVLLLSVWTLATGVAQAATPTAQYEARFDATWSALTHPIDFPNDAHWSPLIGGTHDASASFWSPGTLASQGIKDMAERGRTTPLDTEVQAAIAANHAGVVILGGSIALSPGVSTATFGITQQFPLATLVSMVAPSPDWFVGVHGLPLFVAGDWVNLIVVPLFAYDAGTDSGTSFASANLVTSPAQPIATSAAAPFLNGAPLGTLTFTRIDVPTVPVLSARGLAVTCLALAGLGVLLAIRRRAAERA
jgi:hypothetical protein